MFRVFTPMTETISQYLCSVFNFDRATSTTNVMSMSVANPGPLTRRSSERELANGKKRATSAGGLLDRKNADGELQLGSAMDAVSYFCILYFFFFAIFYLKSLTEWTIWQEKYFWHRAQIAFFGSKKQIRVNSAWLLILFVILDS